LSLLLHQYHPHLPYVSVPLFCVNAAPPTEVSTLPLHDALPIFEVSHTAGQRLHLAQPFVHLVEPVTDQLERFTQAHKGLGEMQRSEEHTSELQSRENLVCRPLPEKKNYIPAYPTR